MTEKNLQFTSRLSRGETIAALLYIPLHLWLLPGLLLYIMEQGRMDIAQANFLIYAIGLLYMLGLLWRFLRRDFDPLCDRPVYCLLEILKGYGLMYLGNLVIALLFTLLAVQTENINNAEIMDMGGSSWGKTVAMSVFMAPIVEECIFRAGIFGSLRRYSRWGAYAAAVLAFSLYHVAGYALTDPSYWLFALQYVPVSILLCRVYERCNSIWGCIFFHMLVNYIALNALKILEGLL